VLGDFRAVSATSALGGVAGSAMPNSLALVSRPDQDESILDPARPWP
jgi:hypothetical protein